FEQRFLCKFALGLGFNRIGERFLESQDAVELRAALWSKTITERVAQGAEFSDFFQGRDAEEAQILAWPGMHTIMLYPKEGRLIATIYLFGKTRLMVTISKDES